MQDYAETVLFESRAAGGSKPDWRGLLARNGIRITRTIPDLEALSDHAPSRGGLLLVAGGDGTLNEAVSRILDVECTLGVLPGGTGNDFARSLGLPLNAEAACRALGTAREFEVDVAEINDRVLLNASHVGVGSVVSSRYAGRFKRAWGRLTYLRGLLAQMFGRSGFRATIRLSNDATSGRWRNITVANGRCFGGGHMVDRRARLDEGLLDVLALKQRPWWQLVWAGVLKRFGIAEHEALRHWRVSEVEIKTSSPHQVVVDGDVRTSTPVHARVRLGVLRVLAAEAGPGLEHGIKLASDVA